MLSLIKPFSSIYLLMNEMVFVCCIKERTDCALLEWKVVNEQLALWTCDMVDEQLGLAYTSAWFQRCTLVGLFQLAYPYLVEDTSCPLWKEGFIMTNLAIFIEGKAFRIFFAKWNSGSFLRNGHSFSPFGSHQAPWCFIPDRSAIQWCAYWPKPASSNHPLGKNSIMLLFLSMKSMFVSWAPWGDATMSVLDITLTWTNTDFSHTL